MDTQNKAWAEDRTKFGYRMLEKMGWKEGKGLGAKEDGMTSHIRVKRKRCNGGVGTQGKIDAMWRVPGEVATGFNDVLSRIATESGDTGNDGSARGGDSPEPTEPVTKVAGKGKISYFGRKSRQKNVRQYSEAQLREIFGGAAMVQAVKTPNVVVKPVDVSVPVDGRVKKKKRARKEKKRKNEKSAEKSLKAAVVATE